PGAGPRTGATRPGVGEERRGGRGSPARGGPATGDGLGAPGHRTRRPGRRRPFPRICRDGPGAGTRSGLFLGQLLQGCLPAAGEPAEALAAFSACVALAPQSAWCFHNRGLAYAALVRLDEARADFDRALVLDKGFGAAYLARSAVHHRAGRHPEALADLQLAAK